MIKLIEYWAIFSVVLLYTLWLFFTAVMRLREVRDAGNLSFCARPVNASLGYLTLLVGAVLDVVANLVFFTVIGLELPQIKLRSGLLAFFKESEWLSTARMCRWYPATDDRLISHWRADVARFFGVQVLDDIDPDGNHIK